MTTVSDNNSLFSDLGFNQKEAAVYAALSDHGELSISEIADFTGIRRTTLYTVIEGMVKRGIIGFFQQRSHRTFFVENPEALRRDALREAAAANERAELIERELPELMRRYQHGRYRPSVSFHQGKDELRRIAEDVLLQDVSEVLIVCQLQVVEAALGADYLKRYVRRRIDSGISVRTVYTADSHVSDAVFHGGKPHLRPLRIAPPEFEAPVYTGIYGEYVMLLAAQKESYGILIKSKSYADTMRHWFEVLWASSKAPSR